VLSKEEVPTTSKETEDFFSQIDFEVVDMKGDNEHEIEIMEIESNLFP
jgi:hypothetical protein